MKLSEWAKRQGVHYQTARRWFQQGVLPVNAVQLETGTILVEEESEVQAVSIALYGRVSSLEQKADLEW